MFSRIKHAFSRPPSGSASELKAINQSPLFNASWYAMQYGVPQRYAAEHYVESGWRLGYNPSPQFHTQFYLEAHPDVAESGMNPLLHYILHGQAEGRPTYEQRVGVLFANLWGGHAKSALAELLEISEDSQQFPEERFKAAWEAARWYSFVGDHAKAYELAELMAALQPQHELQKERVLLVAVSLYGLGRSEESRPLLERFMALHPNDGDPLYFYANTFNGGPRLAKLSQAFTLHGFVGLAMKDTAVAPCFDNVQAHPTQLKAVGQIQAGERVSVIIPAYNAADKLHVAIESLLAQTWRNLEVVVVDDCSPDNTVEVAQRFAAQDNRVKVLQQPKNAGAYAARNLGLKHITGSFVTTHDSDDWSHPQKLENQMKALQAEPELMGVMTHWVRSLQDLTITQNWRPSAEVIHWSHSSFLFRREVLNELGQWDEVRIGADTEFIWRVQQHYGKRSVLKILPQVPMAIALDDDGSLTRTKATHVRTVYFGLRHIYRQHCDWWHRTHSELYLDNTRPRQFVIPQGMRRGGQNEQQVFDQLIVSDFSDNDLSEPCYDAAIQAHAQGQRLAFLHWPQFGKRPKRLRDRYFELVNEGVVLPVVFGDVLSVPLIVVASADLIAKPVDALPQLLNVERVVCLRSHRQLPEALTIFGSAP